MLCRFVFFFFQAEDGIRDIGVTGVQTCALPICARRETFEETGLDTEPDLVWWARVEPWRTPDDPELYAGVGFLARYSGGEVSLENSAHDDYRWVNETEWRSLRTWYTSEESSNLWEARSEERRVGKECR